jgi:hypothetical protein
MVCFRVGGVEAVTFCCLSAIYDQMQEDKRADVFLHASLCQQARTNAWRKQVCKPLQTVSKFFFFSCIITLDDKKGSYNVTSKSIIGKRNLA